MKLNFLFYILCFFIIFIQYNIWLIMTTATIFDEFLLKLKVTNAENISLRYGEVTRALNLQFRDNDNRDSNRLQVGSYGRYTAIKGVSDLDMLYIMPASKKNEYYNGGQLQLLKDAKQAIQNRYPLIFLWIALSFV